MTDAILQEVPFDATRVARFLRVPSGDLFVAVVNLRTGREVQRLPLRERTRNEILRVVGVVKRLRERLAAPVTPPEEHAPVAVAIPGPMEPTPVDGWDTATPGERVRWEPRAALVAKRGLAPVEGTLRGIGATPNARFARIVVGDRVVQVWANQGALHRLDADAPRDVTEQPAEPARRPARRGATAPSARGLDAAGLATVKRAVPSPNWRGPAEAIKALRAVETVLPLLGDDPRFDAIRREVGAVRRWIETGVDGRHVLNVFRDSFEPPKDLDFTAKSALDAALMLQAEQFDRAYSVAQSVERLRRADVIGMNYPAAIFALTGHAYDQTLFARNPTLRPGPPPSPERAIADTVKAAEEASDGWLMREPSTLADHALSLARTPEASMWIDIARSGPEVVLKSAREEVDRARAHLLGELARAERAKAAGKPFRIESYGEMNSALDRYELAQTFTTALAAGLRDPSAPARAALEARVAAEQGAARAVLATRGPRVELILGRVANAIEQIAIEGAAAIEAERAERRELRVAQAAGVAGMARDALLRYADMLRALPDPDTDKRIAWDSRLAQLEWLVEESWTRSARPTSQGFDDLVPYSTGAAYAEPMRELVREHLTRPVAKVALDAIREIGWADGEALADAGQRLDWLEAQPQWSGPWFPLHDNMPMHSVQSRWEDYATGAQGLRPVPPRNRAPWRQGASAAP